MRRRNAWLPTMVCARQRTRANPRPHLGALAIAPGCTIPAPCHEHRLAPSYLATDRSLVDVVARAACLQRHRTPRARENGFLAPEGPRADRFRSTPPNASARAP